MLLQKIMIRNLRFLLLAHLLFEFQLFFLSHLWLVLSCSILLSILCSRTPHCFVISALRLFVFHPSLHSLRDVCTAGISVKPSHLPVHLQSNNQLVFIIFLILLILLNRLYGFNPQKSSSTTKIF